MKIISLTAENIKKLVAVEITPDGNMVQITGKNGQGKTSVLDSIWWALAGADHIQAQPIRKGAKTAKIRLDLGNLKVTRSFTEKGTYLTVETEDGAKYGSPQQVLDKLIGALTFDPLGFSRMKPKDQFDELRRIAEVDIDFDGHARADKRDFDNRTEINRQAKQKRAAAEAINILEPVEGEPIDTAPILDEIAQVGEFNANIEARKERRADVANMIVGWKNRIDGLNHEISELKALIDAKIEKITEVQVSIDNAQKRLDEAEPLPEPKDAAEVRARLEKAEATNRILEQQKRRDAILAEAESLEAEADAITKLLDDRKEIRAEAMASAKMPVEGLGFGEGIVTFNGIPLEQASSAEQLRVSMAIAMAANPKLRVIRIQDGSLLDDESMAEIASMADEKDYQVWIERVDASGKVGFVVEDGHVRPAHADAAE